MRFLFVLIFSAVSSTLAFADVEQVPIVNSQHSNVTQIADPEAQSVAFFPKKKKKSKSKAKKRNKSMGKKLRRKNDDTLRRD